MNGSNRVHLLERLVSFDTTSSNSNLACLDALCDELDRPGIRLRRLPSPDGTKANLLVEVGPEPDGTRRGLLLSGHTDVVPALEPEWTSDPFTLRDDGARLFGRGTADMKGFLALAVEAARAAATAELRAPLALLLTYDEEVGTLGAQRFAATWPEPAALPRLAVIGEPTSLAVVRLHKGHLRLRVTVRGVPAHSSMPHLGCSAIEAGARAVTALGRLRATLAAERPELGEYFGAVPFVTLNVGRIAGGAAVNVIPDRCVLDVGVRLLPGMPSAPLVERVRGTLEQALAGEAEGIAWELTSPGDSPPLLTGADAPHAVFLAAAVGQTETRGVAYASDAGPLQALGVESVLFGPGSIDVAHKPNEWLPRDELERAAAILDRLVERFCGAGARS